MSKSVLTLGRHFAVNSPFGWRAPRTEVQTKEEIRRLYQKAAKPKIRIVQCAWSNNDSINTVTTLARDKTHKILKGSI